MLNWQILKLRPFTFEFLTVHLVYNYPIKIKLLDYGRPKCFTT